MKKRVRIITVMAAVCMMSAVTVHGGEPVSESMIGYLSELSGMDASGVEQILTEAGISEEELLQMTEEEILEGLRVKEKQESVRDFSYLFTEDSIRQTLSDTDSLQRVAVYSSDDAICPSLMIDYEEGKIYYSGGIRIFDDLDRADSVTDLDEETAQEVARLVREILEKGYDSETLTFLEPGTTLAGLAIETDLGVTSFTIQNVQDEASLEQSNYVSQIFRIYFDSTGQGW